MNDPSVQYIATMISDKGKVITRSKGSCNRSELPVALDYHARITKALKGVKPVRIVLDLAI